MRAPRKRLGVAGVALLLALPAAGRSRSPQADAAYAELEAGRFAPALERAADEPDALRRARALADVHYRARDFDAVLELAAPGEADAHVLWRAAGAALWKQDGAAAAECVERLGAALERAAGAEAGDVVALDAASLQFFSDQRDAYAASAAELTGAAAERTAAVGRAKATVAGGLAAWALLCGLLLRRVGRAAE